MTAPAHIAIGIAIYYAVPDPVLAIPMSILSHPLLDMGCVYHPDSLLKVDSLGKKILLGVGILISIALVWLVKCNINAYIYGIAFAWMGFDIQWLVRFMWGKDVLPLHQWVGRVFRSDRWEFIAIELIVMVYGLYVIWRNLY